jgi:hypothetical protein
LDGVSRLPLRQGVAAHYGAGVWWLDFSGLPSSIDGIPEDARTTWGNTLGWIVMPGADTWSAKEYKGFIYAGDMGRGFDVYRFVGPTAVKLTSFRAERIARGVRLAWRTASEAQTLGFNVYRSGVRVNARLIPAKRTAGATYALVDSRAKRAGGQTYRLQAVGFDGKNAWLGRATVR